MDRHDPSDPDVIEPVEGDPLAFLYDTEDEEEADDSGDHPGYSSLLGVSPRKEIVRKKTMALVLDVMEAQRAAEVMEINAGQLMTNPDRSNRNIGFLNLDPLDAMQEVEEEEDLAESLSWAADEDDDPDWQPENPLAGTGIAQEDEEDADWQPENPLAGTGIVQEEEDDLDWQPENPLAGTGLDAATENPDWQSENPLAGTEFEAEAEVPEWHPEVPLLEAEFVEAEVSEWQAEEPLSGNVAEEPADWPAAHDPPVETPTDADEIPAVAVEDDWIDAVPSARQFAVRLPAFEDEQAWTPDTPAEDEAEQHFAEVEWEALSVTDETFEDLPSASEALDDVAGEAALPDLETPEIANAELEPAQEPTVKAPIPWQTFLEQRVGKQRIAAAAFESEEIAEEPADAGYEGDTADWADSPIDTPAVPDAWEPVAGGWAEPPAGFAAETPEADWQPTLPEEEADERFEPLDTEWDGSNGYEAAPEEWSVAKLEPEPAEPQQIEIVRFPAPPVVELPRHSLRAKVLQSSRPRRSNADRVKAAFVWLWNRLKPLLPHLRRLLAWAVAQRARFSSKNVSE